MVLATFAQPVPDRSVTVVANVADVKKKSVLVELPGPGNQGWRPPVVEGSDHTLQSDPANAEAPQKPSTYGVNYPLTLGVQKISTIVVEIQVRDPKLVSQANSRGRPLLGRSNFHLHFPARLS